MIMDKLLELDPSGTAITVTRDSTNIINLVNDRDIGIDYGLTLVLNCTETFTAGGAGTLDISIQYSADDSTYYIAASSRQFALADLVAGTFTWRLPLPPRPQAMIVANVLPQYIKLVYTVGTGPMTAGKIGATIVVDAQNTLAYAPGVVVNN
jgi:hypothetical protein